MHPCCCCCVSFEPPSLVLALFPCTRWLHPAQVKVKLQFKVHTKKHSYKQRATWFAWVTLAVETKEQRYLEMVPAQEREATISSSSKPPLIYDYYGFPKEAYSLQWPAPGSPDLAGKVSSLLSSSGIPCHQDATRGLDHGAFIPLMLAYPEATIPTVQLSLISSLHLEDHVRLGEALAPLREEGVLIFASGMTFHNMGAFRAAMAGVAGEKVDPRSKVFDAWLHDTLVAGNASYAERRAKLLSWADAPEARYAHPREEHLLPLLVAFGASQGEAAKAVFSEPLLGAQVSSFQFG